MQKLYPIVFIGPQDYGRFKSILSSALPDSYDEWLADHAMEKNAWDRKGFDVREIQIFPVELTGYGRSYRRAPTVVMLHRLAFAKAMRPDFDTRH
jgi:hypothetical protein